MDLHRQLVTDTQFRDAFKGVMLYGVAGTNGSGKDTIMSMMADSGFIVFNAGDSLREITTAVMGTTQRGGNDSPTGKIANFQRSMYPGGMVSVAMIDYWSRILHLPEELRPAGLVIGSIRAVGEAETIKAFGGKMIVTNADAEVRYKRMVGRGRAYEQTISIEQFKQEEAAEMAVGETDPTKFGMAQVIEMADITIDNSGDSPEDFIEHAKQVLALR